MTNLNFILRVFATTLGVGSLIFVVYDRLKTRLPFEITDLTEQQIYFIVLILLINIFWFGLLLHAYWKFKVSKSHEPGSIKKYLQRVLSYMDDTLTMIYLKVADKIPELCWILITSGFFICQRNPKTIFNIILGIIIIPRIIVSIIFFVDIFWFSQLLLFYKSLGLLLIPLFLDLLFFVYKHLFTVTKNFFEQGFCLLTPANSGDIEIAPEDLKNLVSQQGHDDQPEILLKPHVSHLVNDPEIIYMSNLYRKLIFIEPYYKIFFAYKQHCKFLAAMVWRFLYIIGWSYVIFLGTNSFTSFPF